MAGAAGGFLIRAFESMLKECSPKKYWELQKAIQSYLDTAKEINQHSSSSDKDQAAILDQSSIKSEGVEGIEDGSVSSPNITEEAGNIDKPIGIGGSITVALASAGQTLGKAQAELVLQPLRLAFETKNLKLVEPALDCLHKLIAYDHLEGDPGLDDGQNAPLFTDILNRVCGCVDNSSSDSTILQVLKVLLTAVASTKFRVHGEPLLGVIRICYNIALNSKSPINQATSKAMLTQMISIIFRRMESDQDFLPSSSSNLVDKGDSSKLKNENTALDDQNEKEIVHGDASSTNWDKDAPIASVEELQNLAGGADIKGLEAVLDKAVNTEDGKKISRGIELESMSMVQHDALLLFRTLCKMGMKEENDEVTVKTRLLSLELLLGLLEGVSHSFTKNFHFIDSVKAYLSYALLRASVSQSPIVFQHATGIFSVLLLRFRESLKGEIGVFFPLIVLRSLDSSDGSLSQRTSVLRMLDKVCMDPQMLVDIFVNYDCDLEAPNLFERMVTSLSKLAQGSLNADPNSVSTSQATSVKGLALQCLVSVLKSLLDWERSHRVSLKQARTPDSTELENSVRDSLESKVRDDVPSMFEKAKAHKSTMETAISEFNRKPGKGVEYLIANMLVENTPLSVAQFLRNSPGLDKAMIGDYLGQHEDFPISVMHGYVDSMNFSGMKFDSALRVFLQGFRLPGEAQKIDRIMEKFAERYCADNSDLFKNADTAYVLAYAVIMLNTDSHNPMVWPKMSKSDFIRINTMSDAEESAPKELLEEIYDSIIKEEIKMKDDFTSIGKSSRQTEERGRLISILNLALPRRKSAADIKSESDNIIKQMQVFFKNQGAKRGIFHTAQQIELVRPMVEAVGWPLLATFSVTMEEGDNKPRVLLCMEGFRAGIHIARVLGMDTMRYAFLTSLVRFTFLHAPKEMRSKNVEALRTLLAICDLEKDSLQDTWNAVLECVSRLEFITSTPAIASTVMLGSNQISRDAVLQSLRELSGKPSEQVYVNSVKLPSDSVVEFFTALCGVSAEELKQTPARVFSLQKLVEISYYNMARIRMVWARIWSVLANHFISAGSHHDEKIAMYAIDSLRQLGMKYLERAELNNFTFQNDILKPFVVLMRNSRSESIRGLIVDCIVQMIKAKVGSIKSGWRSVFMIFTAAADDELESIVESAFENVEQVILEHFDQVVGDCFMDCVNCLIGFANNKSSHRISLKAIALLRICEDRLAEPVVIVVVRQALVLKELNACFPESMIAASKLYSNTICLTYTKYLGLVPGGALKPIDVNADKDATFDMTEHYWFPMLAGLSDLTSDPRAEVRNCALEVLFDLLNERGRKFSSAFWESIFHRVLFPIFDHVRDGEGPAWFLLMMNGSEVCFMLPPLLGLLLDCAKKMDQNVVSISLGALVHLIEIGGHQFSDRDWDTLLNSISNRMMKQSTYIKALSLAFRVLERSKFQLMDASYTTQPVELLNSLGFDDSKSHSVLTQDLEVNTDVSCSPSSTDNAKVDNQQFENRENVKLFRGAPTHVGNDSPRKNQTMATLQDDGYRNIDLIPSSEEVEGLASPSGRVQKLTEAGSLQRNQTLGQRIMGNMMDNLLLRSLTAKSKNSLDAAIPSSPMKGGEICMALNAVTSSTVSDDLIHGVEGSWVPDSVELDSKDDDESPLMGTVRGKCITQPPLNLLRQELAGTCIYLDILEKTTSRTKSDGVGLVQDDISHVDEPLADDPTHAENSIGDKQLEGIAEEKLVSFCGQILKEASDLHSGVGDAANVNIHRVLELRSPIIVKVLRGMSRMNQQIFKRHLREFYPLITKLVCCDQVILQFKNICSSVNDMDQRPDCLRVQVSP
ncbi:hypothetical protein Sjap_007907 [Stephania japonica]|uniref:SEC7 domain-containing protein n=1 Tax=Stephania japonica TaxID=461633 RepID=A0AAP0JQ39_9MAGN